MQNDLQRIENDQVFKRWLKEQQKGMEEPDLPDLLNLLDLGIFDGPVSGRR